MISNKLFIALAALGIVLASCKRKGCMDERATNYEEKAKKDDQSCEYKEAPSTYAFTDTDGNSTVSYNGQKQRLDMLEEMVTYLKIANTKGTTLDVDQLKKMYANDSHNWADANNLEMTGSSKQLKNKTAGGDETITNVFEKHMEDAAAASALNQDGSPGTAGVYPKDGKGPYLMSAEGHEYTQLIEKGLMGAVFYYNIVQVYLGDDKMNVDNETPEEGKSYTEMEHHWDEAFGYFTSEVDYPANGTDRFIGKYANNLEGTLESGTKIMNAFLEGRNAIANNQLDIRDAQREILKKELEIVFAGTAIHYINSTIENISKTNARNHALSEAYAFIDALKYGANGNFSTSDVNDMLTTIGNDFNNVSVDDLNTVKDQIASKVGLENVKNSL